MIESHKKWRVDRNRGELRSEEHQLVFALRAENRREQKVERTATEAEIDALEHFIAV
jgi:hypothetical protein